METSLLVLVLLFSLTIEAQCHGGGRLHHSLLTDQAALLAFKNSVILDPHQTLASWLASSHVCNFFGVTCGRTRHRVKKLQLGGAEIYGALHPSLANLTRLKVLDLAGNHLRGPIPRELGSLSRLTVLELSENEINGSIPDSLGLLSGLVYLDLRSNRLSGRIPTSLLYNCSALAFVDLAGNDISGEIPPRIGNYLTQLSYLNLYSNELNGSIPTSLANLSKLEVLDVENNSLSGELPSPIVAKLKNLVRLQLSGNFFVSHDHNRNLKPFFEALANCSHLKSVQLAGNGLRGMLPSFAPLLGTNISIIHFEDNWISGPIPPDIGDLSNLTLLNLSSNLLRGTIPEGITLLQRLEQLILSNNKLSGAIPSTVGGMTSLGFMDLSLNRLSGELPASFGKLSRLECLLLQENNLTGAIPSAVGSCGSLRKLVLSYNNLTGFIPASLSLIRSMESLNLSHNHLQGPVPSELSTMERIAEIDLSSNNLTGNVIPQLESCASLKVLNLSHNHLEGKLPDSFGRVSSLQLLDVSYNQLTGSIPLSLNVCTELTQLNLSYNDFNGTIPPSLVTSLSLTNLSFLGNPRLCGSVPAGIRPCKGSHRYWTRSKIRLLAIVFSSVATFSVLLLLLCCIIRRRKAEIFFKERDKANKRAPALKLNFPRITYKQLEEATGGFDQGRLIGSGGFGQVYKGTFKDGTLVAVKVLRLQTGNSTKSFNKECQVLKRIRHRNLIRIITACSLPDFKAVVLPFMANGSLESHLYPTESDSGLSDLSLIQRVNICSDIAEGMAYLHHHSPVRVIHCDLKPSNVLLNDDMTALVSDFGNARLVMIGGGNNVDDSMGASTANMLCGSIGYMAPEYGLGSNMSTKGDVYSYGVLVLEMVTGKRPTDDMFVGGLSLNKWVKSHYHGRVEKVIDRALIRDARDLEPEERNMWEVAIGELIELGLICTQEAPSTRPTMQDVADELDRLKRYLTGDTSSAFASSLGLSSSTVILED